MAELAWFECFPPRNRGLADVTAMVRVLAGRPRQGVQRLTPIVTFELQLARNRVRWLLGMDTRLAHTLPDELRAQLPLLDLAPLVAPERPMLTTARELRFYSLAYPLRLDVAYGLSAGLMQVAGQLAAGEHAGVQLLVGPCANRAKRPVSFSAAEALGLRVPSKPDASERQTWKTKIAEPLFGVRGRIGATAASATRAGVILRSLLSALSLANGPHAQLRASRQSSRTAQQFDQVIGRVRTWSGIVNAAELAILLGWPVEGVTVPGSTTHLNRVPQALLVASDGAHPKGRVLGVSLHPADHSQLVTMPIASSTHHLAITGPTGSGKSNLAAELILADAAAGHSILVCEPRGDLVHDVLGGLVKHRHDDVVLIEPDEHSPVTGLNPLIGPKEQAERRADELLDLFKAEFGTAIGPRSSDCLLHTLVTAARLPDGTLTDVPILLTNAGFRRQALAKVNDSLVLAPFWSWFDGLSEAERGQVVAPILNKTRVFTSRAALRRMLGQAQPKFQLDELFTKRRIVLANLNRGLLGPAACRLLGALLLTQCWQAIQRRAALPAAQRHPVMVVVDEFQDFVGALDFGGVLAQARGLGAGFTVINQNLDQLNPALRAATLANARSRVTFRPAQSDARALAAVLGGGVTPDDLEQLGAFQAVARVLVDSTPSQPFAIRTLPLSEPSNDVAALRHASQQRYGVDGHMVDATLAARWQGGDLHPDGPIGISRRRPS